MSVTIRGTVPSPVRLGVSAAAPCRRRSRSPIGRPRRGVAGPARAATCLRWTVPSPPDRARSRRAVEATATERAAAPSGASMRAAGPPGARDAGSMITAVHTLVYADDAEAARAFFRDVL